MKSRFASLAILALVLAPSLTTAAPALAQSATEQTPAVGPADVFGNKGQIAISSDAALSIQRASVSGNNGGTTTIELDPAADYFFADHLSVGGSLEFRYTNTGDSHSSRFAVGPRVGYNFTLSDLVSIWPKVGLSFAANSVPGAPTTTTVNGVPTTTTTGNTTDTNLAINLFVPIMFHPAPHFFAGFGPFLDTDVSGDLKTTVYGGKLTIGGWL